MQVATPSTLATPTHEVTAATARPERIDWLDSMRALFAIIVIFHHAILPYAVSGFWIFPKDGEWPPLQGIVLIDAAYVMAGFLYISGLFTPAAYERAGFLGYLRGRVRRLGVPLLFGMFVYLPILKYVALGHFRDVSFLRYYIDVYLGVGGHGTPKLDVGHFWYLQHLLVYSAAYALARRVVPARPVRLPASAFVFFLLLVYAVTAWIRVRYPIGAWLPVLGFIAVEPAHLPHYVAGFALGIASASGALPEAPSRRAGYIALAVAALLAPVFFYVTLGQIDVSPEVATQIRVYVWPMIETTFGACALLGIVTITREPWLKPSRLVRQLADNSFAAYLVHVAIVVAVQHALRATSLPTPAKVFLSVAIALPTSFAAAALLRKVPVLARFL